MVARATTWELGLLTCVAYPYTLRFLLSSFHHRLARHPRRHTMVSCIALAIFLFFSADRLDAALIKQDVYTLTGLLTVLVALTAITEVCSDVWMQGMRNNSRSLHTLGINFGGALSQCLLLSLHSQSVVVDVIHGPWQLASVLRISAMTMLFFVGWEAMLPTKNGVVLDRSGSSSFSSRAALSPSYRSLAWILLTERLPFVTTEFLGPLRLIKKGIPIEWLVGTTLGGCLPGILAGILVYRQTPSIRKRLWIYAYYLRLLVGVGCTYTIAMFLPSDSAADQLQYLSLYSALEMLSIFCGNVMFTSQGRMIEGLGLSYKLRSKLSGLFFLGSWMPRLGVYLFSDLASRRICYRQNQQFVDVPCPWNIPFDAINNLCTDSGGDCRVVRDGFSTVSYALLAMGMTMGILYTRSLERIIDMKTHVH